MLTSKLSMRRKRLLIRGKRRGILEMDSIIGRFAEENIAILDDDLLYDFEALLDQADQDAFAWISGTMPVPKKFEAIVREIRAWLERARTTK